MFSDGRASSIRSFIRHTAHELTNQEDDYRLMMPALEALRTFIRTSTSSMTSVPKPLKFLRPFYEELGKIRRVWHASMVEERVSDFNQIVVIVKGWMVRDSSRLRVDDSFRSLLSDHIDSGQR